MRLAMVAMVLAVVGRLLHHDIVRFDWIVAGLAVGSIIGVVIGLPLGIDIPMTAMPQFVAISHLFGAVAATLVGVDEYLALAARPTTFVMAALGLEAPGTRPYRRVPWAILSSMTSGIHQGLWVFTRSPMVSRF